MFKASESTADWISSKGRRGDVESEVEVHDPQRQIHLSSHTHTPHLAPDLDRIWKRNMHPSICLCSAAKGHTG